MSFAINYDIMYCFSVALLSEVGFEMKKAPKNSLACLTI